MQFWAWSDQQKYRKKFSEFFSDFKIAKIADQYIPLGLYGTVIKNIIRLLMS
jgi:hypothetical protein